MYSTPVRKKGAQLPSNAVWKVQLRGCAAFIVLLLGIGLFVAAFVYGAIIDPQRYEFRHSESHVYDYHDSYVFDKLNIYLQDGDIPVTVELLARRPPVILLPRADEVHELDLNPKESRAFTWYFVADSTIRVSWDSSCNLRVVLVRTLDALKLLSHDHAPKADLVTFDISDYSRNVTAKPHIDDYYSLFTQNLEVEPCASDFNVSLSRYYYDVTKLNMNERCDSFIFNPASSTAVEHNFIDSPQYPLVAFYTRNATGAGTKTPTHIAVDFHPNRRIDLTVLVAFFVLGFIFVVSGLTVMVMSTQKTFMLYKEMKVLKMYAQPEYAAFN